MRSAIDVCAGAGGFSLGLHRAGWTVLGVERDPEAVETHRRHVGTCIEADVTTWSPQSVAELVVGGVPCQSFSHGGARAGLADERGQLYRHLVRIADEAQARIVVMENVSGLLSTPGAIDAVTAEMRSRGFQDVRIARLCAADYGTPQKRYRLFIVGLRGGASWRWPAPSHTDAPMGALLGLRPWITVREALGLGGAARRHGRIDGASGWNGQRLLDVEEPSPTVTSRTNPELLDAPALTILTRVDPAADRCRASRRPMRVLGETVGSVLDHPSSTISAGGTDGGGGPEPLANREYREKLETLGAGHDTYPDGEASALLHEAVSVAGLSDRHSVRLTADQCAILQGFPSGWSWTGNLSSQHRQIGNAVPPQLGEAIGRAALDGLQ